MQDVSTSIHAAGLNALSPELTLIFFSLVVLVIDLVKKGRDSNICAWVTLVGLAATAFQLVGAFDNPSEVAFGLVQVDKFGTFSRVRVICGFRWNRKAPDVTFPGTIRLGFVDLVDSPVVSRPRNKTIRIRISRETCY